MKTLHKACLPDALVKLILIMTITFILAGLASCSPLRTPLPLPTVTPVPPTTTPTQTQVWFPPTPTYTLYPTPTGVITPTVDIQPEYGEPLIVDNFDDPALWTTTRGPVGSVAMGVNELSIAISSPRGYLYSQRQGPQLKDFYAEITASPSICSGEDEYGMLLRVSPSFDFYRFSLTCDGQTRLDKYYQGTASSPQALTYSSQVPPGAPSMSRLGVWASGKELHFYINDVYQFSVRDPSITSGTLGVFARAAGDGAVTVNYSELVVYEARTSNE